VEQAVEDRDVALPVLGVLLAQHVGDARVQGQLAALVELGHGGGGGCKGARTPVSDTTHTRHTHDTHDTHMTG
jgi:hypothetical protein